MKYLDLRKKFKGNLPSGVQKVSTWNLLILTKIDVSYIADGPIISNISEFTNLVYYRIGATNSCLTFKLAGRKSIKKVGTNFKILYNYKRHYLLR